MQTLMEDNIELDFRAFLFGCLNDTDEQVRATAIESLWEDESTLMLESLLRLVDDPAGRVRVAAVLSLSRFAYRASLAELDPTSSQKVYTVLHALNQTRASHSMCAAVRLKLLASLPISLPSAI